MDERHTLSAVRYIETNPIRAGLCTHAGDWRCSSARAHLQGEDDALVKVSPLRCLISYWPESKPRMGGREVEN